MLGLFTESSNEFSVLKSVPHSLDHYELEILWDMVEKDILDVQQES